MATLLHAFPDSTALDTRLAGWVAEHLAAGIAARGCATLAVSGGRTPVGFFAALSRHALDWRAVTVTLADERCVPADDAEANAALVREHLLCREAAAARFIPLFETGQTPQEAAHDAAARLAALPRFDAVVLGMGDDGHTASLFPGSPELGEALDTTQPCLATQNTLKAPRWRITLSAGRLLHARAIALHITGERKWAVLGQALAGFDAHELPVRFVLHHYEVPCHVFWCR